MQSEYIEALLIITLLDQSDARLLDDVATWLDLHHDLVFVQRLATLVKRLPRAMTDSARAPELGKLPTKVRQALGIRSTHKQKAPNRDRNAKLAPRQAIAQQSLVQRSCREVSARALTAGGVDFYFACAGASR
jgi:hypothetical protein